MKGYRSKLPLLASLACLAGVTPAVYANCTLRQSDALELKLGPFVDATDGFTAETGLTISQADVLIAKCAAAGDCGAFAQKNDATACIHDAHGIYECDFNATDVDTVGVLEISIQESGALPVFKTCQVVDTAPFDAQYADAATGLVGTAQTGDSFARLGAPAGASISADVAAVKTDTGNLVTRVGTPSNLGGGATVAANLSDIEGQTDDIGAAGAGLTAADDAVMTRLGTPAGASVSADVAAVKSDSAAILDDTGTTGVVIAEVTANCREVLGCDTQGTLSGTHGTTTADLGTNAPANTIVGMTLVIPTHNFSEVITSYNTGTGVATWDTATTATLANGNQYYLYATAKSSGTTPPTAAAIADAVWDEPTTGHTTSGTFGEQLKTDVDDILVDTSTTLDDLVDDLESRLGTPSNLGGGATVAANLSDIEGQTDDIGAAGAGLTAADDAVMTRLGTPAGASVSADIAGVESGITWNTAWDAEVQSEVDDALVAQNLDHLFTTDYDPAAKPGAATALLNELIESDAGVSRFTANALEQGPAGGGGSTNVTQIEGSDATDVIDARIAAAGLATASALTTHDNKLGTPSNLGSGATFAANLSDIEGQTDDIGAAGSGLTAADDAVMTRLGTPSGASVVADIATRASQTSVDDLPTNAELATSQASADDATLAAIAALNNLSASQIRDLVIEDQGNVSLGCALASILAYTSGDIATSGANSTYEEATGAETRLTITVTSPGNRTSTITCPSY